MPIDTREIRDIAWLARLSSGDKEAGQYRDDLDNILGLVEQMKAVDTSGVSPLAHPLDIDARMRRDQVTETDQRAKFQSIAPEVEDCYYLVPRVIE